MAYPGRQNIYEATIRRMVQAALDEQEQLFRQQHEADTDAQLITYLCSCAAQLQHTPWPGEIVGGDFIKERFGTWHFAKEAFGITDADIYACSTDEIDFSKRCIDQIEEFTAHRANPVEYFEAHRESWQDSILILRDIFCGIVPMGAENRAWRQRTGRLAQYLSREAVQVSRIFCGLEQRLK